MTEKEILLQQLEAIFKKNNVVDWIEALSSIECPTNEHIYAYNKKCTCIKCWKEWLKYNKVKK